METDGQKDLDTTNADVLLKLRSWRDVREFSGRHAACFRLASAIPLVHRTGKNGSASRLSIFANQTIAAGVPCTECEKDAGVTAAVYAFWGAGCYPHGNYALLISPSTFDVLPSTATPFDSGACAKGHLERRGEALDSPAERCRHLAHFTLSLKAIGIVTLGPEMACAHFENPWDYFRSEQNAPTDHETFHGLESPTNDRRAWTVELQCHADVPVPPSSLQGVIVAGRDLLADLPTSYLEIAAFSEPKSIEEAVEDHCLAILSIVT